MKRFLIKSLAVSMVAASLFSVAACGSSEMESTVSTTADDSTENAKKAEVKAMKGSELEKLVNDNKAKDKVLVIDVREETEYNSGHIKHAISMNSDGFEDRISEIESYKEKPVILYCNTGNRSGKVAEMLAEIGFKDVTNAEGVKDYKYELTKYPNVTAEVFLEKAKADDVQIVDVRAAEDYDKGHIEGAVSVPFDKVEENIDKLDKSKKQYLYCNTGNKSAEVTDILMKKGYKATNVLDGTKEYDFELVK